MFSGNVWHNLTFWAIHSTIKRSQAPSFWFLLFFWRFFSFRYSWFVYTLFQGKILFVFLFRRFPFCSKVQTQSFPINLAFVARFRVLYFCGTKSFVQDLSFFCEFGDCSLVFPGFHLGSDEICSTIACYKDCNCYTLSWTYFFPFDDPFVVTYPSTMQNLIILNNSTSVKAIVPKKVKKRITNNSTNLFQFLEYVLELLFSLWL